MHINNWVHASDLMKMIKSANSISTLSSEEGLPDNHVITIRERELTVDFPELIQNNIKTDTVTLDLDAEWDGIQPVIIFGPNASGTIAVEYTGEPVHIPGAVMQYVGGLDCSVMGLDDSGEVRLVTKAAPNTFEVVESGEYIGQISEDDVSLLGQILSAIKDVETATSDASSAAEAATAAANSANTAATKATNAANSANTAATKATAAANSANTASERAENAYDALTPIIAEIGVNGNQPHATTNPNPVATASDAYAAKPLEICIKGATRQNLWVNPSGTSKGMTATANADGSMTISGTSTDNFCIYSTIYSLKPGSTYTLFINSSTNAPNISIQPYSNEGYISDICNVGSNGALTNTGVFPQNATYARLMIQGGAGSTLSGTYRIMLNEGSTAQPWCPPGLNSVDELSVVTAGERITGEAHNIQQKYASAVDFPVPANECLKPSTKYALLIGVSSGVWYYNEKIFSVSPPTLGVGTYTLTLTTKKKLTTTTTLIKAATDDLCVVDYCYLVENPPATPIDLDGNTLCSLPDGTCDELTIDATGAVTLTKRTQTVQLDGGGAWFTNESPFKHYVSAWSNYGGLPSGYSADRNFVDKLPASDKVANGLYSADVTGGKAYLREPTFASDAAGVKEWMGANTPTIILPLLEPQTIPLTAVTLLTLPSPNITVYHDSDVPSDITVEYVQDINIVLDNLNAKIAALNIAQSISS